MTSLFRDALDLIELDAQEIVDDLRNLPLGVVPEDRGGIRRSVLAGLKMLEDVLGFDIVVEFPTPPGADANYAEILDRLDVIRPTNGDVLSWVDSRAPGGRRYAAYINNVHVGWFDDDFVPWVESRLDNI